MHFFRAGGVIVKMSLPSLYRLKWFWTVGRASSIYFCAKSVQNEASAFSNLWSLEIIDTLVWCQNFKQIYFCNFELVIS